MSTHVFAIGETVSLDIQERQSSANLNPFTVEAQMPPIGNSLQYRIKSTSEAYRRVVAEHQLSSFAVGAEGGSDSSGSVAAQETPSGNRL